MRCFSVSVDANYVAPVPIGWYGLIDRKTLHRKMVYEMPSDLLFETEKHMQMVFTDVVTFPCFMVSEMVKGVMKQYSPFLKFARVVLFDAKRDTGMTYYIPFLDVIEPEKAEDWKELLSKKMCEVVAVELKCGDKTQIIMRMDIVESILRRNAVGIGLKEVVGIE